MGTLGGHTKDSSPARGMMGSPTPQGAERLLIPRTTQSGRRSSERTADRKVRHASAGTIRRALSGAHTSIEHALTVEEGKPTVTPSQGVGTGTSSGSATRDMLMADTVPCEPLLAAVHKVLVQA
jgi:hypothetical protein